MDQLTPEERREQERLAALVAGELSEGTSKSRIAEELLRQGCPDYKTAIGFVNSVEDAMIEYNNTPTGRRQSYAGIMGGGFAALFAGVAITLGSYWLAESVGTPFIVVAWGAILFGAAAFVRGFVGYLWNRF